MKKNKRTLIFALTLTVLSALASCSGGGNSENPDNPGDGGGTTTNSKHQYTATKRANEYLVKEGRTNYKIVISEESDTQLTYAKNELNTLFGEATGVTFDFVYDTKVTYSDSATYISLGQNAYLTSAGLDKEVSFSTYGRDGARIITQGKSIFIFGATNFGTLYGVYDFLKITLNFECYYEDCYTLDKNVKDLSMYDFNVIDIPDVAYRQKRGLLYPTASQNQMFPYRMRVTDDVSDLLLPIYENGPGSAANRNHNSFFFFPEKQYKTTDPDFYSVAGNQLCFTARGVPERFEKMTDIAAAKIEESLTFNSVAKAPTYTTAFLGQNDIQDYCSCEACTKVRESHYGSACAPIIIFMNRVGKKVNEWMALPENAPYKRNLNYSFFAYLTTIVPPFKQKADGTFEYSQDIIPDEGVNLMPYVASMNFDYGRPFYSDENKEAREILKTWGNFYPGAWSWTYGGFYNDYITFFDIYSFYEDFHSYLKNYKYSLSFEQVKNDQRGADPGFGGLSNYVLCKKNWDSSLPMDTLINDYITNVYEDAAPAMREMFQKLRLWFAKLIEKHGIGAGGQMQGDISSNAKYYDGIGFINELFDLCDDAYKAIEIYKKDEAKYKRLSTYIDIEWLIPAKVAISCFEAKYLASDFVAMKTKFKDICIELKIKDIKEFTSINSYLESLGV